MENQPRARRELLDWLRAEFKCSIDRIEECGSGAMYLQIIDRLYPNTVPMNKVNWLGNTEYEMLKNFKLLQEVFKAVGLSRGFNIDNLIKKKFPDNLELLQWFYNLYEKRVPEVPGKYDALARRRLSTQPLPAWATKPHSSAAASVAGQHQHTSSYVATRSRSAVPPPLPVRREKDRLLFYESKLKAIAAVCSHTDDPEYIDKKVVEFILQSKDQIEIDI